MFRLIVTFLIFASIIYYYNIDIIKLVERSGAPEWLTEKGFTTKSTPSSNTATDGAPVQ